MKLFKVYDKNDRLLGHISAEGEGEALEKAKQRNKLAVKIGAHTGGIPQSVPAKEPVAEEGKSEEKKPADEKKKEDKK